jgi:hypothetical protein
MDIPPNNPVTTNFERREKNLSFISWLKSIIIYFQGGLHMDTVIIGTENKITSSYKQREFVKNELTKRLNAVKGLVWNRLRIDTDGYISVCIDDEEKMNNLGELGYYRTVSGFFHREPTLESVVEKMLAYVMEALEEERKLWQKAAAIFKERYKNTPVEDIPTRRSKAYVLREIYREELNIH